VTYMSVLPNVFPYVVYGTRGQIQQLTWELLSEERSDVPAGSSFAVVTAAGELPGERALFLSEASYTFIKERLVSLGAKHSR
jgi:hypothetical protein